MYSNFFPTNCFEENFSSACIINFWLHSHQIKITAVYYMTTADKKFLGELLLSKGLISKDDLDKALCIQERHGGLLGEILLEENLITLPLLLEALKFQYELYHITSAMENTSDTLISNLQIRKKYLFFIKLFQVTTDFLMVLLVFWITFFLTKSFRYFGTGLLIAGAVVMLYEHLGLYRINTNIMIVKETCLLVKGAIIFFLLFSTAQYFSASHLQKSACIFSIILLFLSLLKRSWGNYCIKKFSSHEKWSTKAIIYGAGKSGQKLYRRLGDIPQLGFKIIGFLDDDPELYDKKIYLNRHADKIHTKVLGNTDILDKLLEERRVGALFVAVSNISPKKLTLLFEKAKERGVLFSFIPDTGKFLLNNLNVGNVEYIPAFVPKSDQESILYHFTKRVIDIFASIFFLILLLPLFTLIAWIIKKSSNGPIFFVQKRVGLNGQLFDCYKFRSMHINSSPYAISPEKHNDPRITSIGQFLRRSSLDELPQLWNVLKGDMSLVGPRPEMPFIVDKYLLFERQRLKAKPGMTGLWQISAERGYLIHENIEYDLYYIENRSLLLDAVILFYTPFYVLKGIGAF